MVPKKIKFLDETKRRKKLMYICAIWILLLLFLSLVIVLGDVMVSVFLLSNLNTCTIHCTHVCTMYLHGQQRALTCVHTCIYSCFFNADRRRKIRQQSTRYVRMSECISRRSILRHSCSACITIE